MNISTSRSSPARPRAGDASHRLRRLAFVLVTSTSTVVGLPAVAMAAPEDCAWRATARDLARSLGDEVDAEAERLREVLQRAGISPTGQLPAECRSDDGTGGAPAGEEGTSAAETHGWGTPNRVDDFSSAASAADWSIYDGPGHAGNGRRTPDAVSISDGVLTITGDSSGATAGMAWNPGQKYGRWEGRVKAPASDESYNALLLLWPDAENFPVGGEIDFMEMMDHTRQQTNMFLHYGPNNDQVYGEVDIDATEWHNWAVEWTPDHVATFVDGEEWWRTEDTSILPPGPMHLSVQLDWFPAGGDVQESYMYVDWVKQYSLDGSGSDSGGTSDGGSDSGSRSDSEPGTGQDGPNADTGGDSSGSDERSPAEGQGER